MGPSEQEAMLRNAKAAREAQEEDKDHAQGKETQGEEQAVGVEGASVVQTGVAGVSAQPAGGKEGTAVAAEEPAATAGNAAEDAAPTTRRCAG